MPAPTHHEIQVQIFKDSTGQENAIPDIPTNLVVGDTVHYTSPFGAVRIEFGDPDHAHTPSPFQSPFLDASGGEKTMITSGDPPLELKRSGIFFCHCFVKPPNGPEFGWGLNNPLSGGDHVVRRG